MLFKIGAGLCCFPQRNASALGWGLFFTIGTFVCVAQGTGYVVKLNLPYQAAALAQLWWLFKISEENHQLLHLYIQTHKVIC